LETVGDQQLYSFSPFAGVSILKKSRRKPAGKEVAEAELGAEDKEEEE
jgi:hypothetical protein